MYHVADTLIAKNLDDGENERLFREIKTDRREASKEGSESIEDARKVATLLRKRNETRQTHEQCAALPHPPYRRENDAHRRHR